MTAISYHSGERGIPGFLISITGSDSIVRGAVIPGKVTVDSTGAEIGTSANPFYTTPATSSTQNVQGTQANASAVTANPVLVAGSDGTSILRLLTNATGQLSIIGQGNVAAAAADSGNPLKTGGKAFSGVPTAVANAQRVDAWYALNGQAATFMVDTSGTAVTMSSTSSDANSSAPNALAVKGFPFQFNGTTWDRSKKANAVSRIASAAATTNATVAKASAGDIHQIIAYNTTAAVKYLKLYNKASAPTVGTDTPTDTLAIPPNGSLTMSYPNGGKYFATGIAFALTGAAGDADTTALAAGDVVALNISYD